MIAPARTAAFTALRDVNAGRVDLPAALASVRPTLQDERDRALATDLVTGTLRWQRQLDYLIEHFAKRPLAKLDFEVLQILRLGAYQLLHLDRVPAAAAVNDAVAMTRRARKTSAAGLVNAVLRALSRNSHRLPLPLRPPDGDPLPYLEVSLSHPGMARRSLARPIWIRRGRSMGAVQQRRRAADDPREPLEDRPRRAGERPRRARRDGRAGALCPGWTDRDGRQPAANTACRHGTVFSSGRSVTARRAARRAGTGNEGARYLRVAGRQDHRDGGDGRRSRARSLRPMCAARACNCFATP